MEKYHHTTDFVNENSEVVVLELYDLIKSEQSILLSTQLKTKLSEKQLFSFSESFKLQDTVKIVGQGVGGGGGSNAPEPLDIVLSYKHSLIIVSLINIKRASEARERVLAFDLKSRKYIGCLITSISSVQCILVEENYDGKGNEALYLSLNKTSIEKFDLKSLIKAMNDTNKQQPTPTPPPEPLWKTDFEDEFYGMCVDYNCKKHEERCLYACGTNNVCQFKTSNGKLIDNSFFECMEPWGIRMNNRGDFIVSLYSDRKIQLMERNNAVALSGSAGYSGGAGAGGWNNTMSISVDVYTGGLCIDETNQNIIACSHTSITIYSSEGRELVKRQDEECQKGKGCFLDSKTGELYVAACGSGMITIWK